MNGMVQVTSIDFSLHQTKKKDSLTNFTHQIRQI